MLFPDASCARVLTSVREIATGMRQPIWLDDLPVLIQPRIGIAQYPDHTVDPSSLLRCTSFAAFAAARAAQDYQIYDPLEDREHNAAVSLLTDLQGAIESDQVRLHYQPKVDLRSGRCIGVEAPVRWKHFSAGQKWTCATRGSSAGPRRRGQGFCPELPSSTGRQVRPRDRGRPSSLIDP